mmetsp:Transcript_14645/g.33897  ORF Transcript_14645/g.33897 Transcript_14645/m.33897 type:complete len:140 (-) Transcript_14645:170-589(-)
MPSTLTFLRCKVAGLVWAEKENAEQNMQKRSLARDTEEEEHPLSKMHHEMNNEAWKLYGIQIDEKRGSCRRFHQQQHDIQHVEPGQRSRGSVTKIRSRSLHDRWTDDSLSPRSTIASANDQKLPLPALRSLCPSRTLID